MLKEEKLKRKDNCIIETHGGAAEEAEGVKKVAEKSSRGETEKKR